MDIAAALHPCTLRDFLAERWGRTSLHAPGPPDRFAALCSWDTVRRHLQHQRIDPECVTITGSGQVDGLFDARTDGTIEAWWSSARQRISAAKLAGFVRSPDAAMVLRSVHESDPAIAAFAEHLEDTFAHRVDVDLVLTFAPRINAVHADHCDLLILNVVGHKHWALFEPVVPHPLPTPREERLRTEMLAAADALRRGVPPPKPHFARELAKIRERPRWSGTLAPGDVLYIPRGWYHEVTTDDPPNMHLACGFAPVSGISVARWLVEERLMADPFFRAGVPVHADPGALASYAGEYRARVDALLTTDVVAEFLRDHRQRRLRTPRVDLPAWLAAPPAPLAPDAMLQWALDEPVHFRLDETFDELNFHARGQHWEFEGDAHAGLALLVRLRDGGPCRVHEAIDLGVALGADPDTVLGFCEELVRNGLVVVR